MLERTARVVWLSEPEGGHKTPPIGPRYSVPVGFESSLGIIEWWSVLLEKVSSTADSMEWTPTIRFLFADAPSELLCDGTRFDLMEGSKRVGTVTIGSVGGFSTV
jgi:hypothetical protein